MWNVGQESESIISFDLRISRSPAISFPTLTVASVARVTVALFVVMLTTRVSPGTAGLSSKRGPLATKPRFAVTSPRPRLASALTGATDEHLSRTRADLSSGHQEDVGFNLSTYRRTATISPSWFLTRSHQMREESLRRVKRREFPADLRELPEEFTQHESSVGVVERSRSIGH
jgi:hypothetical protein